MVGPDGLSYAVCLDNSQLTGRLSLKLGWMLQRGISTPGIRYSTPTCCRAR
jgi:hypothetical protein